MRQLAQHSSDKGLQKEHGPFAGLGAVQELALLSALVTAAITDTVSLIGSSTSTLTMLAAELMVYASVSRRQTRTGWSDSSLERLPVRMLGDC